MQATEKITLTSDAPGKSMFMLGNEAIARGAIEAGIQVYAAYPGTPSSEISETLINLSKELGFYGEWSINEKVAFEVAYGACTTGVRAMTSMKMVGLNVAHDALAAATYTGTSGGMVLMNADDPGIWSSQNEQDNRYIAEQVYVPIFEPASIQEAKDMTVEAFKLSEQIGQIIMLRSVTRISHARGDVKLGILSKEKRKGEFKKEPRFSCLPVQARVNHQTLLQRFEKVKALVDDMPFNNLKLVKGAKLGIIASGISYSYVLEALRWLGIEEKVAVLKIGTPHPLPERLVRELANSVQEILVVEELEPFVENHVRIIIQKADIRVKIYGKDMVPMANELSTRKVTEIISKITKKELPVDFAALDVMVKEAMSILPARPPTLCAGCPHRASFYAFSTVSRKIKKDLGDRVITGDIGCYTLGYNAPSFSYDINNCMGGGFGLANGVARGQSGPVIGHLGDSTFFHSGIPAMINAVFNNTKVTFIILDNSATSMTGFQPHPGAPGNGEPGIKPEDIARACNVKFVEVVDCFDLKKTSEVIEKAVRFNGPAVIISRGQCAILSQKEKKQKGEKTLAYQINLETCTNCKLCLNSLGCPAILIENDQVSIDALQCNGCSICAQICPTKSIIQDGGK
jgi:indolepyruvate ferredoxin oxidoreductase, alpha subunit